MKPDTFLTDTDDHRGLRGKTGTIVFTYRYRSPENSNLKPIRIRSYPDTTLADARNKLAELKAICANGICPATQKSIQEKVLKPQQKTDKTKRKIRGITVKNVVDHFLRNYIEDRAVVSVSKNAKETRKILKGARKPKGQTECMRSLEKGYF